MQGKKKKSAKRDFIATRGIQILLAWEIYLFFLNDFFIYDFSLFPNVGNPFLPGPKN